MPNAKDLSVLIPARNEMFLKETVEDVLRNARADTEVIVVLDGQWPVEPIPDNPKLTLIHHGVSIGQRAATNEAARLSQARHVMKLDAHCSVAEGFDVELIQTQEKLGSMVTQIPAQYNLHAFDWVCGCGERKYQGPTPTSCKCGSPSWKRELVWKPRKNRLTTAWRFDQDLHFQYWPEYQKRSEGKREIAETMSCLGACFFLTRERYWQIGGMDEGHGSWGQMGTELGCKSWLSGGRMVVNKRTWFAHMFRTQGGDFGFPYPLPGRDVDKARKHSKSLWIGNSWPGAIRPLSWLIDHFAPVPGWEASNAGSVGAAGTASVGPVGSAPEREEAAATERPGGPSPARSHASGVGLKKGIVYYSDCQADPKIMAAVREQLRRASNGHSIVSVTLKPIELGHNIVLPLERGVLTMFKQILAGLEASDADIVFLAEHDVLYSHDHFQFVPSRDDTYYYNENTWKVDAFSGHALFYYTKQTSGLCAHRKLLVEHYRKRVARVEAEGYSRAMGYEPGTHRQPRGVDDYPAERWMSDVPNVDIRHGHNLTRNRWKQEQFRDKNSCLGWTEATAVPGWGVTKGRFEEFLNDLGR